MKLFPGGPFDDEVSLHPEILNVLEKQYGLNQPIHTQYKNYLAEFFTGSMGISLYYPGQSVKKLIVQFAPTSLMLGFISFFLAVAVSMLTALISLRFKLLSKWVNRICLILVAVPTLLMGPLLIYFFGFYLNILPVALLERPSAFILPVIILSLRPYATLTKILKSSLEEAVLGDDIKTMRAYGFSEQKILFKWALRKAVLPFLSQLPSIFAGLLAGSVLVEVLFAIPGLGTQYIEALLNRDVALVVGLTVAYGAILIFAQNLIDFVSAILDRRLFKYV